MAKRILPALLALVLMLAAFGAVAEEETALSVGDKGTAVVEMKERLYELGYYNKDSFTRTFTDDTADRLKEFQRVNGLEETGMLDTQTREALYSDAAIKAPVPTPQPYATPAPTPVVEYPARDEDGYLAEAEQTEFVYENDDEGLWVYLSDSLQVTITRREDNRVPLIWFETDIRTRGEERLRTVETNPDKPGTKFRYPYDIARDNGFVLGFSDDFYGDRVSSKKTLGIIIREGKIISDKTNTKASTKLPNLDMMAQYADGTLKVYRSYEYTAQELLDMGAINVFSFGPVMIRDGEISSLMVSGHYSDNEPRQALGMIEPGHYFLVSVQGRLKNSQGCDLWHVAGIMLEHGVTEALNLDGGNTMALVFRGRMLNKLAVWNKQSFVRTVTSLIGVGYTENMAR